MKKKVLGLLVVNWVGVGLSWYSFKKIKEIVAAQSAEQPQMSWEYKGYTIANNRMGRLTDEKRGFVVYHPIYDGAFTVYTGRSLWAAMKWIDQNDVEEMGNKLA